MKEMRKPEYLEKTPRRRASETLSEGIATENVLLQSEMLHNYNYDRGRINGVTRGVTVSTSALQACHQCGFESRLGLEFSGFSM